MLSRTIGAEPASQARKVELVAVSKTFTHGPSGREVQAILDVSFVVQSGEFVVIIGPSGCGKSTLLYMIAGFELPTRGEVLLNGEPVKKPGPDRGIVFQEFALYPWRTVLDNVAFGLELQGMPKRQRKATAQRYVEMVGLGGFEDHYPHTLSGGMRQRVAVARALAYGPDVLLMDEPFGALDEQTKQFLIQDLHRIWQGGANTILFVTHSIKEAVLLADRVIVMTARPSVVKETLVIDLPRPRDPADARCQDLEAHLFRMISDEISVAARQEREELSRADAASEIQRVSSNSQRGRSRTP